MPAPDIETLYQFENAIEAAADSILVAAGLNSVRQRDTDTLATPWAACQLSNVSAAGSFHMVSDVGWPSDFTGTLTVAVTTNRLTTAASHTSYVGKVRRQLYDLTKWTAILLPYHKVWNVMETGTNPNISESEDHDTTLISFSIKWLIVETAWP